MFDYPWALRPLLIVLWWLPGEKTMARQCRTLVTRGGRKPHLKKSNDWNQFPSYVLGE